MDSLGNPENKIKTIHIAGTSGKTSTSYYIAALLTQTGLNIGLTVSPHIDKISERAQVNGQPLEEDVFCAYLSDFLTLLESTNIKPSYFELLYAFSIWLFTKLKLDYAVIETGVGGLYDATNIVTREDKVCVITDIGFDHMKLLGNTLSEIAYQKVGIVHEHNVLLMYKQNAEIMNVIQKWILDHKAKVYLTEQVEEQEGYGKGENFNSLPEFQKRNWLLAYYVYRYMAERDNLVDLDSQKLAKTQSLTIPARMDISKVRGHTLIMDGAHNFQKMNAFLSSYKQMFPKTKPTFLVAFKTDKVYKEAAPQIVELADKVIVTTFKTSQDLPVTSADPKQIADELTALGAKEVIIEKDNLKAYELLLKSDSKQLIITGSFYLIAQIRDKLRG
jgi:dihydrofolate synthase/folylpolyglutamate synthase